MFQYYYSCDVLIGTQPSTSLFSVIFKYWLKHQAGWLEKLSNLCFRPRCYLRTFFAFVVSGNLLVCWGPTLGWHLWGPGLTQFAHSKVGTWVLEILDGRNRDTKENKQSHRIELGGHSVKTEFACIYFNILVYSNLKVGERRMKKDCFNMIQKENRAITCFNTWNIKQLYSVV